MKYKTEKAVKDAIKKVLSRVACIGSPKVWYYMPSSLYKRGIPDFICCIRGRFVAIEAKKEDVGCKGLTPLQIAVSRDIIANGGEYIVVWDNDTLTYMRKRLRTLIDKR